MSTRRLKDAMGFFFLYKSHLYKDGCLYCQIYITYLQVIAYVMENAFILPMQSFREPNNRVYLQQSREMDHSYFLKIITIVAVIVISIIIIQDNTLCFSRSVVL